MPAYIRVETNAGEVAARLRGLAATMGSVALASTVRDLSSLALDLFKKTTATWHHRVHFYSIPLRFRTGVGRQVGTNDMIYNVVNFGRGPMDIFPRTAPLLVFQPGYTPRTTPHVIGSGDKARFGDLWFAKAVRGHVIRPRLFHEEIQRQIDLQAVTVCARYVNRFIKYWGF